MLALFVIVFFALVITGIVLNPKGKNTKAVLSPEHKIKQIKNKNDTPKDPLEAGLLTAANMHLKKKHR
jgi:hypothetical protein